MIKTDYCDIKFHHKNRSNPEGEQSTACVINLNDVAEFTAVVKLHKDDKHDPERARKYAMAKAFILAKDFITKEQRRALWALYRDSKQGGRW